MIEETFDTDYRITCILIYTQRFLKKGKFHVTYYLVILNTIETIRTIAIEIINLLISLRRSLKSLLLGQKTAKLLVIIINALVLSSSTLLLVLFLGNNKIYSVPLEVPLYRLK